ncbi:MAG TPA: sugar ABC transporter substrate-binding protein [Magnetospirillaceae bacterium]|jgi:ABC-type sugar transport system substrate-binding protein
MSLKKYVLAGATALAMVGVAITAAHADHFDDGQWGMTAKALKGKTVAYVPISMGFDLAQGWAAAMQKSADKWGYKLVINDPNWSASAGVQAIGQLLAQKPDVLVIQPFDPQSYAKLIKKALDQGTKVVQINMESVTHGDAYVGSDWYDVAATEMDLMEKACGKAAGKNGKIALIPGIPTNPGQMVGTQAINDKLKQYPDLQVVATQAAEYDPTKAHDVALTILKQHPDLCGIPGTWDGQDVGTAAAIKEAGLLGKVYLVTSGGGRQAAACDYIANGSYSAYVSYDGKGQGRDLVGSVVSLLQDSEKAGSHPVGVYSSLKIITKETMSTGSCWTIEDIKANGA